MATAVEKYDVKGILKVKTTCVNQNAEPVVNGQGRVRIYQPPADLLEPWRAIRGEAKVPRAF